MPTALEPTLVIWWRFGKEHAETEFRVNPPEVIAAHLDQKLAQFRAVPTPQWRWWTLDHHVIVERPAPDASDAYGADTRIYYLVARGLTVIEHLHLPSLQEQWQWYLHLADLFYDAQRACWINKDLFCDILIAADGRCHQVLDLADLGEALTLGLVSPQQTSEVLRRLDAILHAIAQGRFPFPEIVRGQALCHQLGWEAC